MPHTLAASTSSSKTLTQDDRTISAPAAVVSTSPSATQSYLSRLGQKKGVPSAAATTASLSRRGSGGGSSSSSSTNAVLQRLQRTYSKADSGEYRDRAGGSVGDIAYTARPPHRAASLPVDNSSVAATIAAAAELLERQQRLLHKQLESSSSIVQGRPCDWGVSAPSHQGTSQGLSTAHDRHCMNGDVLHSEGGAHRLAMDRLRLSTDQRQHQAVPNAKPQSRVSQPRCNSFGNLMTVCHTDVATNGSGSPRASQTQHQSSQSPKAAASHHGQHQVNSHGEAQPSAQATLSDVYLAIQRDSGRIQNGKASSHMGAAQHTNGVSSISRHSSGGCSEPSSPHSSNMTTYPHTNGLSRQASAYNTGLVTATRTGSTGLSGAMQPCRRQSYQTESLRPCSRQQSFLIGTAPQADEDTNVTR